MKDVLRLSKEMAKTGKPFVRGGRSHKHGKISFDDLVFIPAQLNRRPVDYHKEDISSETVIGKTSKHPLKLSTPVMIGAMSFGALSKEAKIAIANASSLAGTATNTGEGGMLPEERENAKILIAQYATSRFGVDEEYLKKADAIEIKIGQGAKPGQGGLLTAEKVTEEIAEIRKVPHGKDVHSPPAHQDILTVEDLKKKVDWLRETIDGKPIIIKFGAGDVEKDVELAVKANPDVIAIDGSEGGTAAAPHIMLNDFGIPTLSAVVKARKTLDRLNAKQELLVGGGINKGSDVAKAIALGADAVFVGTSILIAMGCTQCELCPTGKCPFGITTQDPELRKKIDIDETAKKIANYINACTEEVKIATAAVGNKNVHDLNRNDLRALDLTVSKITDIGLV
jgi:glutamate synthase domain-containing protein 2